jgi:peptidoglycan/LPS O-acetylase OafA/YrhL
VSPPPPVPPAALRVANLDLLRAAAIAIVVASNASVEAGGAEGPLGSVLRAGWVGVDLFFVLSGWLIGGLYWRERERYGDVQLGRFWARRWLRTIPAYLVALHVVYLGKRLFVDPALPYDARYLLFVQNYIEGLPYWAVSWSLCVEEHFYLALPLALGLATRLRWGVPALLVVAAAASLAARVLMPVGGLHYTATHMRLEGLALGVWASWVYHCRPTWWPPLERLARAVAVPGLLLVVAVPFLPADVVRRFAYTGVDLAFAALLVAVATRAPLPTSTSPFVRAAALASYSIYMTHTVVLEAVEVVAGWGGLPPLVEFPLALALTAAVGGAFYLAVERPTLWLRERYAPRRDHVVSPALAPVPGAP